MEQLKDLLIPATVCLLIAYATSSYLQRFVLWKSIGINGEPLYPFLSLVKAFLRQKRPIMYHVMAKKYGKVYGAQFLGAKAVMVCDPEVVVDICVKNFDKFTNHGTHPFMNKFERSNLVWRKDEHWRYARSMISPAFTSKRMKKIVDLLQVCSNQLVDEVKLEMVSAGSEPKPLKLNLLETFTIYALDAITTCGYGMKLPPSKSRDSAQVKSRDNLIRICTQVFTVPLARYIASILIPFRLLLKLKFNLIPESSFYPLVEQLQKRVEARRKTPRQHDDLMQAIIDVKYDDKADLDELDKSQAGVVGSSASMTYGVQSSKLQEAEQFTDFEIISDLTFLLSAGLHTTARLMSSCIYALANHPELQSKLHEELKKIATTVGETPGYSINYDDLMSNHLLDAYLSETLRLLSPTSVTDRMVSQEYHLPKYNATIRRGNCVLIAIYAIHHDPEYWPEPEKFDPSRFLPENKHKIVPGSYIPFGFGPRHCVGMRFALTEAKMGIAKMVLNFKFDPAPGVKYPPEFRFGRGFITIKHPFVLVTKR